VAAFGAQVADGVSLCPAREELLSEDRQRRVPPVECENAVEKELGLTPSSVLAWVRQAEMDAKGGGQGALLRGERAELAAVRRENRVLRQERDILNSSDRDRCVTRVSKKSGESP
jgi:transposase